MPAKEAGDLTTKALGAGQVAPVIRLKLLQGGQGGLSQGWEKAGGSRGGEGAWEVWVSPGACLGWWSAHLLGVGHDWGKTSGEPHMPG